MNASSSLFENCLIIRLLLGSFLIIPIGCGLFQQPNEPVPGPPPELPIYYGDLHNHSELSDGLGSAEDAYCYARDVAGLDFFSLADHCYGLNEKDWSEMRAVADKYNEDGVFTALWGFEWSSGSDENLLYGHCTVTATDDYCTVLDTATDSFTELRAWLSTRDGVAFFNHPNPVLSDSMFNRFSDLPSDKFVGMEVWSMNDKHDWYYYNDGLFPDDNNRSCYDEALARGWKIGATCAGDNHNGTWGTETDCRMAVLAEDLTRKDILAAIKARRFYATTDKNIALSFTIDGNEMGSTVTGISHTLNVTATDSDDEPFTKAMLFNMDHDTVDTWTFDTTCITLSYKLTSNAVDYFYIKITQEDRDEAISSPIWIAPAE